eukprot:6251313-Amphidinium_carterae.1
MSSISDVVTARQVTGIVPEILSQRSRMIGLRKIHQLEVPVSQAMVLAMQQQDQSHAQSNVQLLHAPPPVTATPVQQSQLVTDVFDKHFRNVDTMSTEQIMDKLHEGVTCNP